jgi:hypothetical protein
MLRHRAARSDFWRLLEEPFAAKGTKIVPFVGFVVRALLRKLGGNDKGSDVM